jgi:ribosome-binding protein aMBF1 (putative translation factor)
MKYPNLIWAIEQRRLAQYELAKAIGITESRLSRCLSGRLKFSDKEQRKLSGLLRYGEDWLFAEITPPSRATSGVIE